MAHMKHQTAEFEAVADYCTILRTQVGSGVHGTHIAGTDDRDEMGICVEPPSYVIGLKPFSGSRFQQYEFRTQEEHVRSGHGDLDLIIFSLRKWLHLALNGNPTVILPLFVPESEIVQINDIGWHLRANVHRLVSKQLAVKYLGYLNDQRMRLLGQKSKHTNRPELIEQFGFDTKFAMHMVRLGMQGEEITRTGRLTLPMHWEDRQYLLALRRGEVSKEQALDMASSYEESIRRLVSSPQCPLPDGPDREFWDNWMVHRYQDVWDKGGDIA